MAPGMIVERDGKSVFAHQPANAEEELAAWRALLVCPTASVGIVGHHEQPPDLFPQGLAPGVYRCGYNAKTSYGAHSYFVLRPDGSNLLVDSPRFTGKLVAAFRAAGGIGTVLLTHRDDVADADRYAETFEAKVWIHADDRAAAPYATDVVTGEEAVAVSGGVLAIPVPGHTHGSMAYLVDDTYLFTGDSLAWSFGRRELVAFRAVCWYSWEEQIKSLRRLGQYRFEWVLAGHGGSTRLPAEEMHRQLLALVERMPEMT
jgi:glyoxylase-like metal-dependent hydrolase (beta-lactamase superfamily II)